MKIHQYEPFYSLRTRSETETPTTSKTPKRKKLLRIYFLVEKCRFMSINGLVNLFIGIYTYFVSTEYLPISSYNNLS